MTDPLRHPTTEELSAFSSGQLLPSEAQTVESHIERCDTCCETLLSLSADDTFVDLLQEAGKQLPDASALRGAAEAPSSETVPDALADHSRYEIIERIGTGGMGDVYKARHRVMNRIVAVKVINSRLMGNSEAVERFRREVHAAAQLSHPHIVASHDAEQADNLHFLVMEYVSGVNLAELVKQQGPLSMEDACRYIRQAAMGLQYAHQQGMVHRDMKPHNLMLDESGTTKILDFGLSTLTTKPIEPADTSTVASELTASGSIMGTPDYISPEQAKDAHAADIRSDIYSLGATLYFLLSGRAPFVSDSATQTLKCHVDAEPDAIEAVRTDVSPELAAVVRRMMAKNPADRYSTPAEVATALAPFAPESDASTTQAQASRHRPRRRLLIGLACAVLLALAGVLYVVTDNGTLVIKAADEIEILVRRQGEEFQIIDTVTGTKAVRLPSGKYEVSIRGDRNTYTVDRDSFELKRGSESVVTVSRALDDNPPAAKRKSIQLAAIAAINELGGGMRFDKQNPALVTVRFDGERIKDAHLIHVERLENIQSLYLPGTSVTDDGLRRHVRNMKTLVNLYLPDTKVTDDGLRHLVGLKKLRVLYVNDLPITDEGLVHVRQLEDLVGLSLDRTQVTDAGINQFVSKMPRVSMLFLRGTQITDAGLESLHGMKQLHHLDVKDTAVTENAVKRFKQALPECKVVYE